MAHPTRPADSDNPNRVLRLLEPFSPDSLGVVRITEVKGRKVEEKTYACTVFRCDFGIGMAWENTDEGKTYHVNLDGPHRSTCDCPWGTYGCHKKPCRHVAAGLTLQAEGRLVVPPVEEPLSEEPITDRAGRYVLCGA